MSFSRALNIYENCCEGGAGGLNDLIYPIGYFNEISAYHGMYQFPVIE